MFMSHIPQRLNAASNAHRIIVTGSDARYFPVLQELVASIRRFPEAHTLAIGCVDGGLTPAQIRFLEEHNISVRSPHIPSTIPNRALKKRPSLAIGLSKLWLNTLFPEYDTLLWLDADAWVQQSSALELLFSAAEENTPALATIPELFPHKPFRLRWTPFNLAQVRSILYKNATLARLPKSIRRHVAGRPTLNGGIFALSRHAPHWSTLQNWQQRVLKHGKIFSSDQLALSLCVHVNDLPAKFLPARCNYLGPWLFNSQTGYLCEHTYPHLPAGIIHLAGYDAMRLNLNATTSVFDETGTKHQMNLRFSSMEPQLPQENASP